MQPYRMRLGCFLCAFATVATGYGHSQAACTVTLIKDAPLRLIRGVSVFQGVEGMRLRQGDVVETGPAATAQVQLECSDAIIELGPSTEAYLFSQSGSAAETILLAGWLKGEATSGNQRYVSPLVSATTKGGNVLLHSDDRGTEVFVESGSANVSAGSASIASSREKIFFTRRTGKALMTANRPSEEFVGQMPVSFRDALPSRLSRFTGAKPPSPKREHDVSYAEIESLLTLPSGWRKGMAERFEPRLQDRSFRAAIESHIAALPEWKPILYPDKTASGSNPHQ